LAVSLQETRVINPAAGKQLPSQPLRGLLPRGGKGQREGRGRGRERKGEEREGKREGRKERGRDLPVKPVHMLSTDAQYN